jgi:hypothetical protein
MPSPLEEKECLQCGRAWQTRTRAARTCSPRCRAQLREKEHGPTKGAAPRDYPQEIVERIRHLYVERQMTRSEVQDEIGPGVKVENVMRRYGIDTRAAAPRNQTGERNAVWRGDAAGYKALHLRVATARGKPQLCVECGKSDAATRYEWANLTGNYADTNDYKRLCIPCHRIFDAGRRARGAANA